MHPVFLNRRMVVTGLGLGFLLGMSAPQAADAVAANPLKVVVNSSQDGEIQADDQLTLREAIALTNGTLLTQDLSAAEQGQVSTATTSSIEFDLSQDNTTIELKSLLPPVITPGVMIDATTQPGYRAGNFAKPAIALTPAPDHEVIRGLTLAADDITVRGFSLYGFTARHRYTATTPPADIFIVHQFLPENHQQKRAKKAEEFKLKDRPEQPPQGILIEQNWLGIPLDGKMPTQTSAFGVSVFNSRGTTIRQNRIAHHDGSAIITGDRADNLVIHNNKIIGNGIAGMPDAIRLDGRINQGEIRNNLICGNDGAAIFMFKPDGSVKIHNNQIKFNGQRLRRSAIYLMGNDHQVSNNLIYGQSGPGVTVAAYPKSDRNLITENKFGQLEGLSIDLVTRNHVGVSDFQRGDGANVPQRDTGNRRRDTGNRAINTPEFLSPEFIQFGQQVGIDGIADPGATIALYRVLEDGSTHGPLSEALIEIIANEEGRFAATLMDIEPGARISAIATHPDYGTSEPALNAMIRTAANPDPLFEDGEAMNPTCNPPVSVQTPTIIPVPIRAEIPRNVHFALDQDDLSVASQSTLDQIVSVLMDYPAITVDLHGHTDSRASQSYNQDLAQRRAQQVRRYLLQQGIDPARITIRSFGETQLLTDEGDRVDHARNRRVELIYHDAHGIDLIVVDQEQDLQVE